jgi:asparagine synthetase B (glutamine-hydrolysing)
MCGLFGVNTSTLSKQEINNTLQLGIMSQLRGTDSTGMIVAGRHGNSKKARHIYDVKITKDVVPSGYFLLTTEAYQPFKEIPIATTIVGHCRAATIGSVTVDNAHPFEYGDIVGVHNGTLVGTLADEAKKLGITDSEMFYRELAESTLQKAIDKCGFHSAYAFVWIDKSTNTLNLLRNSRRPLYLMYDKHKTTTYWASEKGMLNLLAERENPVDFLSPFMLKDDVHVMIELGDNSCVNVPDIRPTYVPPPPRQIAPYEPADGGWWSRMSKEKSAKEEKKKEEEDLAPWETNRHPKDHLFYKGYDNFVAPVRVFRPKLAIGCCNCMAKCDVEDETHWIGRDTYLCGDCNSLDFVKENFKIGALNKSFPGGIYKVPGFVKDKVEDLMEVDPNMTEPTCH